ncbi:MAG TPA: hemolysin III family protein [Burkholderiaceae bacterium]
MTTLLEERPQTLGEEIANAVSHGIGFLLAIASLPLLVVVAARHGTAVNVVAVSVFSATMIVLYLVSALYHAAPEGRVKAFLNRVDHAAIYLFIAGSYTPFALGVLHGAWGWTLFGAIWAMAAAGVAVKLLNLLKHPLWSTGLYVAMGWFAIVAAGPLIHAMPWAGLAWLLAGGIAYTAGAVVFMFDSRVPYLHFAWHLFVLAGTTCHFFAALWYAAPAHPA